MTNFINFFFVFYYSFTILQKTSYKTTLFNLKKVTQFSFAFTLAFITILIGSYNTTLAYLFPIFILWIGLSIHIHRPQLSFVLTTLSYSISYTLNIVSLFITAILLSAICNKYTAIPYSLIAIMSGALHGILIKFLFLIKRFRNGMPFLFSTPFVNIATLFCILLVGHLVSINPNESPFEVQLLFLSIFLITLAFLIYWWQAQITKAYRRKLELRELESLRTEVAELNLLVGKLTEENEKLARITHRDNTLITTLKNSTIAYLSTDFRNPAEAFATRDKLISNINALSIERTTLSADTQSRKARRFDTGLLLLDELLGHMDETAIENGISFSVHFATVLTDFVPKDISESDLVHTVDDLLKNAFKATTTASKRSVQLQFYKLGKHFVVEVADNGIPFEVNSLVNMGLEKITTYADGSGIGLVDIWTTKEKYGATYHLDEYANNISFTKKISLTFDKKNQYSIRTFRKDEILQMSKRTDLQVYDYSE